MRIMTKWISKYIDTKWLITAIILAIFNFVVLEVSGKMVMSAFGRINQTEKDIACLKEFRGNTEQNIEEIKGMLKDQQKNIELLLRSSGNGTHKEYQR